MTLIGTALTPLGAFEFWEYPETPATAEQRVTLAEWATTPNQTAWLPPHIRVVAVGTLAQMNHSGPPART